VRVAAPTAVCAGILLVLWAWTSPARSQDTTVLAPEASAARAREVIQHAIRAMGGPAYLNVKDITRSGRFSTFEHSGESRGTVRVTDIVKLPDKERIEYDFKMYYGVDAPIPLVIIDIPYPLSKKGSSFEVRNGDEGWVLGSGGVIPLEKDAVEHNRRARKKDIFLLFRTRLNDPNLVFRYTGQEVVDLKWVDGVEITDADRFVTRIAFDHSTGLPIRSIFQYRDPEYDNQPTEDRDYYSLYQWVQGVYTAFQIGHEHNGYKASQMFYEDVKYNTGLSDSLFTREGLEQMWSKSGKGKGKN
jgi:hypothetical protein